MNVSQTLKKSLFMAVVLCAAASNLVAGPFSDISFEAASRQAAKSNKIVLVDFYTTWCGPCKMLDKNTWTDPAVIQLLEQKTVALRIDAEKETALSKRYKIEAYPSILLIKPDGTEIDRIVGYEPPERFIEDFKATLSGKDSISRARDKMEAAGTNDPSARMQFGVALAQKGKDAEALSEYLWCYDHGLEASPAFVGVRDSFLLMYIKNLAANYPPAHQALETRRDECQAKAAAGSADHHTMQDLIALNGALGQEDKNLVVFDQLPADSKMRDFILPLLTDQFLKARRYADVLQGSDGKAPFNKAVEQYNTMINSVDGSTKKQLDQVFRQLTVTKGTQYFEALAGLKRNQDGKDLAGAILKFDSSETTRTALADAAQRAQNTELAQYVKR